MFLYEVLWGIALTAWVGFVTVYLSRQVERRTNKYVARKFIHMAGGGVVALLAPYIFSSPLIPIVSSFLLMGVLLTVRLKGEGFSWFQDRDNYGEVFFTFSFGMLLLLLWFLDPTYWGTKYILVGIIPLLFMSFGDGITGVVRNYVYRRHVKGFWGSVAMFLVSSAIGYAYLSAYGVGVYGVLAALVATLVEAQPLLDDNLAVPFSSAFVLGLLLNFPILSIL